MPEATGFGEENPDDSPCRRFQAVIMVDLPWVCHVVPEQQEYWTRPSNSIRLRHRARPTGSKDTPCGRPGHSSVSPGPAKSAGPDPSPSQVEDVSPGSGCSNANPETGDDRIPDSVVGLGRLETLDAGVGQACPSCHGSNLPTQHRRHGVDGSAHRCHPQDECISGSSPAGCDRAGGRW